MCALRCLVAPVTAQTNYTNLLAAIQGQNLTGLAQLVRLAGLETALSNPNLTVRGAHCITAVLLGDEHLRSTKCNSSPR